MRKFFWEGRQEWETVPFPAFPVFVEPDGRLLVPVNWLKDGSARVTVWRWFADRPHTVKGLIRVGSDTRKPTELFALPRYVGEPTAQEIAMHAARDWIVHTTGNSQAAAPAIARIRDYDFWPEVQA